MFRIISRCLHGLSIRLSHAIKEAQSPSPGSTHICEGSSINDGLALNGLGRHKLVLKGFGKQATPPANE